MDQAQGHHHHHHGAWNREQLARLERPDRNRLMPIGTVLEALAVQPGAVVGDVGAGLGWLTFPLAQAVGPSGRVIAIDPSRDGISEIRGRAEREGLNQIEARLASAEETGLADGALDRVVWHTMYHDVANRPQALKEMHRILKPNGLWVIVDWDKRPMEMGPPEAVRLGPEEVAAEIQAAGFVVKAQWSAGPVTWGLTAAPV